RGASWAYPKAEDHGSNIAGQGPCIAAKAATQCPLWGVTSRPTSEQGICACGCLLSSRRFGGERFFKRPGGSLKRLRLSASVRAILSPMERPALKNSDVRRL